MLVNYVPQPYLFWDQSFRKLKVNQVHVALGRRNCKHCKIYGNKHKEVVIIQERSHYSSTGVLYFYKYMVSKILFDCIYIYKEPLFYLWRGGDTKCIIFLSDQNKTFFPPISNKTFFSHHYQSLQTQIRSAHVRSITFSLYTVNM